MFDLQAFLDMINPLKSGDSLLEVVAGLLQFAIMISALVAVGVLVYSGIMYITAAGDEAKIEKATKSITYSIIGLVVCFLSVLIINFVVGLLTSGGSAT